MVGSQCRVIAEAIEKHLVPEPRFIEGRARKGSVLKRMETAGTSTAFTGPSGLSPFDAITDGASN